jgi:2-oxoacid:acceptor oxidoreductase delta subunit (pyruvate/2-ketoisovalerate family)
VEKRRYTTPVGDEGLYVLDTGKWRNYRPVIDQAKCGLCFVYCPVSSVAKIEERYQISMSFCKGCGICAEECPRAAIGMMPEEGDER